MFLSDVSIFRHPAVVEVGGEFTDTRTRQMQTRSHVPVPGGGWA